MIHIVLVEPQIPPNTGNVARLSAALKCALHLVHPLGFSTDDRYLKRAGLDYWPFVELHYHDSWQKFLEKFGDQRFFLLTTKATRAYTDVKYEDGDFLIFGSETKGLGEKILSAYSDRTVTIPMESPDVRSLNLSSAVAMVVGEAVRQVNHAK